MAKEKTQVVRKKTRYTGVFSRASESRRFEGKPDICYEITFKVNGVKHTEKVGWISEGYSAATAADVRGERMRQVRHGNMEVVPKKKRKLMTFGEAWQKYLDDYLIPKGSNIKPDKSRYENQLKERWASIYLSDITPYDLERFRNDLLAKGNAPQTAKHALALMRRVINKIREWELWRGDNPVSKIKLGKIKNERYRWLSAEEAKLLLSAVRGRSETTWRICLMSLHTGMRASEIFRLRWGCVDFATGQIRVLDTKNQEDHRTTYLTKSTTAMLKTIGPGRPGDLVFPSRNGQQIQEVSVTIRRVIEQLGLNAGIDDRRGRVVFHTLRHTFASWLALAGCTLHMIGELMGHNDYEMTKRYSHLCPDAKRMAVASIETRLNGSVNEAISSGHGSSPSATLGKPKDPFDGIE